MCVTVCRGPSEDATRRAIPALSPSRRPAVEPARGSAAAGRLGEGCTGGDRGFKGSETTLYGTTTADACHYTLRNSEGDPYGDCNGYLSWHLEHGQTKSPFYSKNHSADNVWLKTPRSRAAGLSLAPGTPALPSAPTAPGARGPGYGSGRRAMVRAQEQPATTHGDPRGIALWGPQRRRWASCRSHDDLAQTGQLQGQARSGEDTSRLGTRGRTCRADSSKPAPAPRTCTASHRQGAEAAAHATLCLQFPDVEIFGFQKRPRREEDMSASQVQTMKVGRGAEGFRSSVNAEADLKF